MSTMPNTPATSITSGAPAKILSSPSASQPTIRSKKPELEDAAEPGAGRPRPRDEDEGVAPTPAQPGARRKSTFFSGAHEKSCFFDPSRAIGMELGDHCRILVVTAVSQAAEQGVRPGWMVTTANFNAVSSPERFNEEICLAKKKGLSSITIGFITTAGTSPAKRIAKAQEFATYYVVLSEGTIR